MLSKLSAKPIANINKIMDNIDFIGLNLVFIFLTKNKGIHKKYKANPADEFAVIIPAEKIINRK